MVWPWGLCPPYQLAPNQFLFKTIKQILTWQGCKWGLDEMNADADRLHVQLAKLIAFSGIQLYRVYRYHLVIFMLNINFHRIIC